MVDDPAIVDAAAVPVAPVSVESVPDPLLCCCAELSVKTAPVMTGAGVACEKANVELLTMTPVDAALTTVPDTVATWPGTSITDPKVTVPE